MIKQLQNIPRFILVLVGSALLTSFPVLAHHSTAAFNETIVLKLTGTIQSFRWINPHSSFKIDAVADQGRPNGLWTVEMTAANALIRQGWKRNSIRPGDKVTVFVHPLRHVITLNDGSQGALYIGIILADGSTLGRVDGKGLHDGQPAGGTSGRK